MRTFTSAVTALVVLSCGVAAAGQSRTRAGDEAALRKAGEGYVAAFNRGDARALAAFMTPDAEYVDDEGTVLRGRAAIEKDMAAQFAAGDQAKLVVTTQSRRFVHSDVVVTRGTAVVSVPGGSSSSGTFTAVWTRTDGQWKISNVHELVDPPAVSHRSQLQDLEFLIGTWVDEDKDATIRTVGEWAANHNFITRHFTVKVQGNVDLAGTQVIGWDPASERIRSWVFDSDGGFSQETWKREGDRWVITSAGVLADGRRVSAINIMRRVDDDHFVWQSTEREVDGELVPEIKPVTVVRASTGR